MRLLREHRQETAPSAIRVLVCIVSHGHSNDRYLARVIEEYASFPWDTHIVVISNIKKSLGDHIECVVAPPQKNPWHLPFLHTDILAKRKNEFDLFIYSEDDILVTKRNVESFLQVTKYLPSSKIAGFFRFETDKNKRVYYPDAHHNFHWDPQSSRRIGEYIFGHFTNEHAGVYMLSREQLDQAILSGGYLLGPHRGKYDYPESAATDIYTQCGFQKMLCVSHWADFLVHHLPNKYIGRCALEERQFSLQLSVVEQIAQVEDACLSVSVLKRERVFQAPMYGEDYYEPERTDLIQLLPEDVRSVLCVGSGWGATEEGLLRTGRSVVAIPLDPIIAACAQARGVEVIECDSIGHQLSGRQFDCLLVSNVLHVLAEPGQFLAGLSSLVRAGGVVIASVPNVRRATLLLRKLRGKHVHHNVGTFGESAVQFTSFRVMRKWLEQGGFKQHRFFDTLPDGLRPSARLSITRPFVSRGLVALSRRLHPQREPQQEPVHVSGAAISAR